MIDLLLIVLLIIANGLFAMSEMAVVSARKIRLQQRANDGDKRAKSALKLAQNPGRFLSTVQVGITLVSILTGAVGGAALSDNLAVVLDDIPALAPYSGTLSFIIVVVGVTYLSLLVGELVPKQIALSNSERIAGLIAAPMTRLSRLSSPLVSLLNASTNLILKLIRIEPAAEPPVTEEEIKIMIAQGAQHGVFEPVESEMVEQVFQLGDQRISALITPRNEIVWLDLKASDEEISRIIQDGEHSRYPVANDSLDDVRGFVFSRDLLSQSLAGQPLDLESILNAALFVPESLPVLKVVDRFKEQQSQIALVIDEYGILQGLVTAYDILQALVGDMPEVGDSIDPHIVQREDGSWLLDGMVSLDVFKDLFDIKEMPDDTNDNHVQTLGGFVMMHMGHIPTPGDYINWADFRFEVVDMDGHRIDKILIVPGEDEPD